MTAHRASPPPTYSGTASLHDRGKFLAHGVFLASVRAKHHNRRRAETWRRCLHAPYAYRGRPEEDAAQDVVNPHNTKTEVYEGVLLEELLRRAGVPQHEQLRGPSVATYVVAEAEDGYRVVFSLAELDSGILDSEAIVADTMDGAALAAKEGPFKIVAPHEKRPAPWVRMLKSITVVGAS